MQIALTFFKFAVMIFSGAMTVYSVNDAFGGGWIGGAFGCFAIFLFEGAAIYWQFLSKQGREGQVIVAMAAQWVTMALSLMSTLVGIALLTTWGDTIRTTMPLGQAMIVLIGLGMAMNMFGFLAYEDAEPEALKENIERLISAGFSAMEIEGQRRVSRAAKSEMEKRLRDEAPELGKEFADRAMAKVRGRGTDKQLPAPKNVTPWRVENPSMAAGGGEPPARPATPPYRRPDAVRPVYPVKMGGAHVTPPPPQPGLNVKPSNEEGWLEDDEVDVKPAPIAPAHDPKVTAPHYRLGQNGKTRVVYPNNPRRTE